jgi:hypothetical protein
VRVSLWSAKKMFISGGGEEEEVEDSLLRLPLLL